MAYSIDEDGCYAENQTNEANQIDQPDHFPVFES
jgi:hypothetical protein